MVMLAPNHLFRVLFLGVATAAPSAAHAGAWIAENQTISSIVYGDRDEGRFGEADLFYERRVAERGSVVAQSHQDVASVYGAEGWRGEALIGGKWAAWRTANGAVSLQTGATWTYEPAAACEGLGGEVRALAGRSWGRLFVNAEGAYRIRGPGCDHGRFDLTAGWRPVDGWLLLGQGFIDRDLSLGEGGRQTEKIQISAARLTRAGHGLQLGLRRGYGGARDEMALVLGLWRSK
jgi:hypothetical protein